jgi:CSLREA domain-containing protein
MDIFNATNLGSAHDLNPSLTTLSSTVLASSDRLQDSLGQEFRSTSSNILLPPPVVPTPDPFVVTSTADAIDANDGVITLREAIATANAKAGADTISFNLGTGSHTITLTNGQLHILDHLTINGSGAANLTISGNRASRVFQMGTAPILDWENLRLIPTNTPTVTLTGLTIAHGSVSVQNGGGILNYGNLTVTNSTVQNNAVTGGGGGGIYSDFGGSLKIVKSMIQGNTSSMNGGGISNEGRLEVISSSVNNNSSGGLGGGIRSSSNLTVIGSTIVDNYSGTNGGGIGTALYNKTTFIQNSTIARNTAAHGTHDLEGSYTSQGGNRIGMGDRALIARSSSDRIGTATARLQPLFNLTVDTLVDELDNNFGAGDLSLREALSLISAGGTINFAGNLRGTIALDLGELLLEKNVTINGLGADRLTISGNQRSRVMSIGSNVIANLEGMTITHGFSHGVSHNNGGGLRMTVGSDVTLRNMMVNYNTAGNSAGGGGIWNDRGSLTAINTTFTGNQAGFGAAILNGNGVFFNDPSSTVTLINSTIAENQASLLAGGIFNQLGRLHLTSSTISGNRGTGVVNADSATVHNTIIAANLDNAGNLGADVAGNFISKGYNLIGNGTGSTGFLQVGDQVGTSQQPIDPKLGPLEDYNGPVYSMTPRWGSRAINAGDPSLSAERDQHGVLRLQGGRSDIGAVEWVNLAPIANNDIIQLRGRSVTFNVLTNDSSPDGDRVQITRYTQPQQGSLTRNPDGSFTYRSDSQSLLSDSFRYTLTDENGASSTATVSLRRALF